MSHFYVNKVDNIDWKFAVAAASSEIDQLGQSFLQMKITIGGKDVFFGFSYPVPPYTTSLFLYFFHLPLLELSLAQFFDFLSEMEKIKANLDSYQ